MTDPIYDAGAWRREALGLRERVRELEDAVADLRAEREALVMVARCAAMLAKRLRAYGVPGYVAVVLIGMEEAIDALPCWCGKPDGHASGCPGGER